MESIPEARKRGMSPKFLSIFDLHRFAFLGGGFKYFLFSPLFAEDFQFDEHILHMG